MSIFIKEIKYEKETKSYKETNQTPHFSILNFFAL